MIMDRFERFEELVRRVKEPGLVFRRKRVQIFQAGAPDATQLGVLHERLRHIAQRSGRRIHGRHPRHPGAAAQLDREI